MVLSHFAAFNGGYRDLEYIQLIYIIVDLISWQTDDDKSLDFRWF